MDGAGELPEYASAGAAGADLRAREAVVLAPGGRAEFLIEPGQLLGQKVERAAFSRAGALAATSRAEGGVGSTGR